MRLHATDPEGPASREARSQRTRTLDKSLEFVESAQNPSDRQAAGSVKTIRVPDAAQRGRAAILPPCRSTISLHTARPIPCPSYPSASWARWKASKTWSRSVGRDADALVGHRHLDPVPDLAAGARDTRAMSPGTTYLIALPIRLSSSCRTIAASACTAGSGVDLDERAALGRHRRRAAPPPTEPPSPGRRRSERSCWLARGRGVQQVLDQLLHPLGAGADPVQLGRTPRRWSSRCVISRSMAASRPIRR